MVDHAARGALGRSDERFEGRRIGGVEGLMGGEVVKEEGAQGWKGAED